MPALPGDAPRKRRRRSRSRLNNRRHSLREGLESREAWQPLNPAGHRLIKKLQSSLTAKECGKHVIGFLLRFWSLAHRGPELADAESRQDRKSTRLNSSHLVISYAVFCLKKK